MPSQRPPIPHRSQFKTFRTIPTRWMDNDLYGHVNNVVYYSYMDTAVNKFLLEEAGLDFVDGEFVCVVAETSCRYHASFTYPEVVEVGLAITHLGRSSIRYHIGLFAEGEDIARADGDYVHICVARQSMRPAEMPDQFRKAFGTLLRAPASE